MWAGAFLAVAGGVAGLVIAFPSPGHEAGEKTRPGGTLVQKDVPIAFAPQRKEILQLAQQFVGTAVARKHVADSWELVCPSLKQGYTKETWAKGDIPVVPFHYVAGKWRLSYAFESEIDLQVALYENIKQHKPAVLFDLTVQPCGKSEEGKWLVSSFIPVPSPSGEFGKGPKGSTKGNPFGIGTQNPKPLPNHASTRWLFVPVGIVGGMVLLVIGFLVLRSVRGRRAYRAYVRDRQISS